MSSSPLSALEQKVAVRTLLESGAQYLEVKLLAGEAGLDNQITVARVQKPGLAMTGYVDFVQPGRVQVLGASELSYLATLSETDRVERLAVLCSCPLACIAVTKGLEIPDGLAELCSGRGIPLLRSPLLSSTFIDRLNVFLDAHLAPRTIVHGVLMDVFGVGVLLVGPSGIGKSECALDLVVRGHRMVSDDVVEIRRRAGKILVGRGPEVIRHHMEVRGLGIINIAHLFGVAATRHRKRVELVIEFEHWRTDHDYDRLGLDVETHEILGMELPRVRLPVASGRSLSDLVEVTARNLLLRLKGFSAAEDLTRRLAEAKDDPRFMEGDYDLDEGDLE